jgi:glycosyltransferase involved in cell wall biosynthesis
VRWADQIVVVDGMSTDDTARKCAAFPRVRLIPAPNDPNLDMNKNLAIDNCSGDWILCLDSDEVVSPGLAGELLRVARDGTNGKAGFYIPRRNLFLGRWMRASGWHPDHVLRFFRSGRGRFPCLHVHERLALDGEAGRLEGEMYHYTYRSFGEYFEKMDRYTTFEARYLLRLSRDAEGTGFRDLLRDAAKRKPYLRRLWWKYMPLKPLFRFFLIYIVRKGFLDGRQGFTLALLSAVSDHVSMRKFRALKEAEERSPGHA